MLFFDCFPMRSTGNSTDITLASSTPECRPKRLRKQLFLTWMAHTCVYTGYMNHTTLTGVRTWLYTRPKRVTMCYNVNRDHPTKMGHNHKTVCRDESPETDLW